MEEVVFGIDIQSSDAEKNLASLTAKIADNRKLLREQKKALDEVNKTYGVGSKQSIQAAKGVDQLTAETKGLVSEQKQQVKQGDIVAGSLNDQRNQLNKLIKQYDNIPQGTKQSKTLKEQIVALTEDVKKGEQATGRFSRGVGDYTNSVREGIKSTGLFANEFAVLEQVQGAVSSAFSGLKGGIKGTTSGFKALRVAIIGTGIGALLIALTSLIALFSKSQTGSNLITKAFNRISAITSVLVRSVESLFNKIGELNFSFDNIGETIKDFGQLILDNIINRFKSVLVFGDALAALFEGDFENAAKLAADGLVQLTTGITNATDKGAELIDSFGELVEETKKVISEADRYSEAILRTVKAQNSYIISNANISKELEKQNAITDDATRSLEEREAAAIKARDAALELANNELKLAQLQEQEARLRFATSKQTIEDEKTKNEAIAARIQAESNLNRVQLENQREINQQRQDLFEQELDFLIDSADNQKTINERKIANDRLEFTERQKIAQQTRELLDESFNEQINSFEELSGAQIDSTEVLKLNNLELLNYAKSLGLSEIASTRFLEVVRERRIAEQDLIETQQELNEAENQGRIDRLIARQERKRDLDKKEALDELNTLQEKNDAIAEIEFERAEKIDEIKLQEIERDLERDQLSGEQKAELLQQQAEIELGIRERADENSERLLQNQIERDKLQLESASQTFGNLATIFGEGSAAGKAFAKVQAGINFALNAQNTVTAISNISKTIPFPANILPIAAEATAGIARGIQITQSVAGFKKGGVIGEKYAQGGEVFPSSQGGFIRGNSHANGGVKFKVGGVTNEAEGGEIILTKRVGQSAKGRQIASDLNASFGGRKFQDGGVTGVSSLISGIGEQNSIERLIEATQETKIVQVVSDFTDVQDEQTLVEDRATV